MYSLWTNKSWKPKDLLCLLSVPVPQLIHSLNWLNTLNLILFFFTLQCHQKAFLSVDAVANISFFGLHRQMSTYWLWYSSMVALVTISISFFFRGPFDDSSADGFLSNAAICVKKMHNGVKKIVKEETPF